jgi:hypothetical protein
MYWSWINAKSNAQTNMNWTAPTTVMSSGGPTEMDVLERANMAAKQTPTPATEATIAADCTLTSPKSCLLSIHPGSDMRRA